MKGEIYGIKNEVQNVADTKKKARYTFNVRFIHLFIIKCYAEQKQIA